MTRWALRAGLFAAILVANPARADKPKPAFEIGYDGLLMAGHDVSFEEPLYGGSAGFLLFLDTKNPLIVRLRVNVNGSEWKELGGEEVVKDGIRIISGLKWSLGMGMGRGRTIMPFVEVGLGPQFMTERHDLRARIARWGWTIGLEGQLGLIFRIKGMFGIRVGAGFSSLSFFALKENWGGVWLTASILFGIPRQGYEPPPEPYYPPAPYEPPSYGGDFYFDAWTSAPDGNPARPVLYARVIRGAGFDDEVSVWVELPGGAEYEMQRASVEDQDLWQIPLFIIGLECGQQPVSVRGRSGFREAAQSIMVYLPCPQAPGGM